MNGRRWGRGNAVLAICWISVLGLAWSAIVGPVLAYFGVGAGEFDPDAGLMIPLVAAVLGGGLLKNHEAKNGHNGQEES